MTQSADRVELALLQALSQAKADASTASQAADELQKQYTTLTQHHKHASTSHSAVTPSKRSIPISPVLRNEQATAPSPAQHRSTKPSRVKPSPYTLPPSAASAHTHADSSREVPAAARTKARSAQRTPGTAPRTSPVVQRRRARAIKQAAAFYAAPVGPAVRQSRKQAAARAARSKAEREAAILSVEAARPALEELLEIMVERHLMAIHLARSWAPSTAWEASDTRQAATLQLCQRVVSEAQGMETNEDAALGELMNSRFFIPESSPDHDNALQGPEQLHRALAEISQNMLLTMTDEASKDALRATPVMQQSEWRLRIGVLLASVPTGSCDRIEQLDAQVQRNRARLKQLVQQIHSHGPMPRQLQQQWQEHLVQLAAQATAALDMAWTVRERRRTHRAAARAVRYAEAAGTSNAAQTSPDTSTAKRSDKRKHIGAEAEVVAGIADVRAGIRDMIARTKQQLDSTPSLSISPGSAPPMAGQPSSAGQQHNASPSTATTSSRTPPGQTCSAPHTPLSQHSSQDTCMLGLAQSHHSSPSVSSKHSTPSPAHPQWKPPAVQVRHNDVDDSDSDFDAAIFAVPSSSVHQQQQSPQPLQQARHQGMATAPTSPAIPQGGLFWGSSHGMAVHSTTAAELDSWRRTQFRDDMSDSEEDELGVKAAAASASHAKLCAARDVAATKIQAGVRGSLARRRAWLLRAMAKLAGLRQSMAAYKLQRWARRAAGLARGAAAWERRKHSSRWFLVSMDPGQQSLLSAKVLDAIETVQWFARAVPYLRQSATRAQCAALRVRMRLAATALQAQAALRAALRLSATQAGLQAIDAAAVAVDGLDQAVEQLNQHARVEAGAWLRYMHRHVLRERLPAGWAKDVTTSDGWICNATGSRSARHPLLVTVHSLADAGMAEVQQQVQAWAEHAQSRRDALLAACMLAQVHDTSEHASQIVHAVQQLVDQDMQVQYRARRARELHQHSRSRQRAPVIAQAGHTQVQGAPTEAHARVAKVARDTHSRLNSLLASALAAVSDSQAQRAARASRRAAQLR